MGPVEMKPPVTMKYQRVEKTEPCGGSAVLVVANFFLLFIISNKIQPQSSQRDHWNRLLYFGEEHMHIRISFDVFTVEVTATCEDANRFAMDEEIVLLTVCKKIKLRTQHDFVPITDHSEYFSMLKDLANPKSPLFKSDFANTLIARLKLHSNE